MKAFKVIKNSTTKVVKATRKATIAKAPKAFKKFNFSTQSAALKFNSASLFTAASLVVGGVSLYTLANNFTYSAQGPLEGVPGTKGERTFIAIKPDGVNRRLVGEIIARFEKKGYKLVALKLVKPSSDFAKQHYDDLKQKPFFNGLVTYFSSGPVVAMVFEGNNVIKGGRNLIGATNPNDSTPGSIRGDLCINVGRNIIHGSDSAEGAKHEINLWFTQQDIIDWEVADSTWINEK